MRVIKAESEESGEYEASKHTEEKTALKQEMEQKEEPCEEEITHLELFNSASEQASTSGVKTEKTSSEETTEDGTGYSFIHGFRRSFEVQSADASQKALLGGTFHFKTLPDGFLDKAKVVCVFCKAEFNYHRSTSSLKYHLKAKHLGESATSRLPQCVTEASPKCPRGKTTRDRVADALVAWIARSCRPVDVADDAGLRELIRAASGDPAYETPPRGAVEARIHAMYEDEKARRMTMLRKATHVALTEERWTSVGDGGYSAITAHFVDKGWRMRSFALDVAKTDVNRHCERFLEVASEWGIEEKVSTVGGAGGGGACAPFEHVPCTAHTLQRAVGVAVHRGFESVLDKCRAIVAHFTRSPAEQRELMERQAACGEAEQSLVPDVATRWNSTLEMVRRILRNAVPLASSLARGRGGVAMLTPQELDKLQKLEKLLEPCRYVTELLGGERYIPCSVVLPALCHLLKSMESAEDDPAYVTKFKSDFSADLAERRRGTDLAWLKIATALDPRFKDLKCLPKDERNEVWTSLSKLLEAESPDRQPPKETTEPAKRRKLSVLLLSSDSETEEDEESIKLCLSRYKLEPKIDIEACPLQWWTKREDTHDRLAPIARKYLSSPATTVPCERLFSVSGHVTVSKRASLADDSVNRLVCLSDWLKDVQDDASCS